MRKAIDIANYLLELFKFDEDGLTNLKLNKLLYYVQGCSYQRFNRPLFEDEIEAWNYGPVIPMYTRHSNRAEVTAFSLPESALILTTMR